MPDDPSITEQWDDASMRLQQTLAKLRTNLGLQTEAANALAGMPHFEKGDLFLDEDGES